MRPATAAKPALAVRPAADPVNGAGVDAAGVVPLAALAGAAGRPADGAGATTGADDAAGVTVMVE